MSDDQSNIPPKPVIVPRAEEPSQRAPIADSQIGAMLGVGRSQPSARAWQPPSPEELQRQFPQYEIREILGRGGMGAVYKGWQKSLQRFVAIKILPPGMDDGGMNFAERFKQEARAMAKFKHPAIVTVHDAGETHDGLLYFIMECIEGTDVAQLVATRGRLPSEEALSITGRVCEAMTYAHERGVIHRDIKPSNVMVEAGGTVKVADFGLAKIFSAESTVNTLSSLSIGTPDFMPPEAIHGSGNVDHRGDIYAVGGMLYQMLTGKAPHGRFEPPSFVVPGLDNRLDAIVDRAMHADPAKRYSSAMELQAELTGIAAAQPHIPPGGAHNTTGPNRHPVSKPLPATLLVTAIVCIAAISVGVWKKNRTWTPPGGNAQPDPNVTKIADLPNPKPASTAHWHNAFAESPLREIVSAAGHTAQGYRLPGNNHWTISPQPLRSGALRVRATATGEKFASLYVLHNDRQAERIRFLGKTSQWLLSSGVTVTHETNLATASGFSPLDEMPHELLLARIGGRLRVLVDGQPLLDEADPNSTEGKFVLDIFPDAETSVEKVEYLELDGVPEAEALKLIGVVSGRKDLSGESSLSSSTTAPATKDAPFVNTLGMKFVPVPGTHALFSVWDTRVQDYAAYARMNGVDGAWATREKDGVPVSREPEYPVVGVSWDDAKAFCKWLTKKERADGKLPEWMNYRLPTDEEWSLAVGLLHEDGATPAERRRKNGVDFPWGIGYPPSNTKVGNYADEAFREKFPKTPRWKWIEGYSDGYATTSPVGSFPPNAYGLYDMGGNVWQWCEDWFDKDQKERVLRGASWGSSDHDSLLSSERINYTPGFRNLSNGFRCVLDMSVR